jgi:hypothetical protein
MAHAIMRGKNGRRYLDGFLAGMNFDAYRRVAQIRLGACAALVMMRLRNLKRKPDRFPPRRRNSVNQYNVIQFRRVTPKSP